MPFYKELANQGISAVDIPVVAFSVGEQELSGVDTAPLVGHMAAWNYFQSVEADANEDFIDAWHADSGHPRAAAVLTALSDGDLRLLEADGSVVIQRKGATAVNAARGEELPEAGDTDKIVINNLMRVRLRELIARLELTSDDPNQ